MRVDFFFSINIFVEGREDKIFIKWLLGDVLSELDVDVKECEGKNCQEAVARGYETDGMKLIISDRDYKFIYSAYEKELKVIEKSAIEGFYLRVEERKIKEVYQQIDKLEKSKIKNETYKYKQYYYFYPLFISLLSLMFYVYLRNKRGSE